MVSTRSTVGEQSSTAEFFSAPMPESPVSAVRLPTRSSPTFKFKSRPSPTSAAPSSASPDEDGNPPTSSQHAHCDSLSSKSVASTTHPVDEDSKSVASTTHPVDNGSSCSDGDFLGETGEWRDWLKPKKSVRFAEGPHEVIEDGWNHEHDEDYHGAGVDQRGSEDVVLAPSEINIKGSFFGGSSLQALAAGAEKRGSALPASDRSVVQLSPTPTEAGRVPKMLPKWSDTCWSIPEQITPPTTRAEVPGTCSVAGTAENRQEDPPAEALLPAQSSSEVLVEQRRSFLGIVVSTFFPFCGGGREHKESPVSVIPEVKSLEIAPEDVPKAFECRTMAGPRTVCSMPRRPSSLKPMLKERPPPAQAASVPLQRGEVVVLHRPAYHSGTGEPESQSDSNASDSDGRRSLGKIFEKADLKRGSRSITPRNDSPTKVQLHSPSLSSKIMARRKTLKLGASGSSPSEDDRLSVLSEGPSPTSSASPSPNPGSRSRFATLKLNGTNAVAAWGATRPREDPLEADSARAGPPDLNGVLGAPSFKPNLKEGAAPSFKFMFGKPPPEPISKDASEKSNKNAPEKDGLPESNEDAPESNKDASDPEENYHLTTCQTPISTGENSVVSRGLVEDGEPPKKSPRRREHEDDEHEVSTAEPASPMSIATTKSYGSSPPVAAGHPPAGLDEPPASPMSSRDDPTAAAKHRSRQGGQLQQSSWSSLIWGLPHAVS